MSLNKELMLPTEILPIRILILNKKNILKYRCTLTNILEKMNNQSARKQKVVSAKPHVKKNVASLSYAIPLVEVFVVFLFFFLFCVDFLCLLFLFINYIDEGSDHVHLYPCIFKESTKTHTCFKLLLICFIVYIKE